MHGFESGFPVRKISKHRPAIVIVMDLPFSNGPIETDTGSSDTFVSKSVSTLLNQYRQTHQHLLLNHVDGERLRFDVGESGAHQFKKNRVLGRRIPFGVDQKLQRFHSLVYHLDHGDVFDLIQDFVDHGEKQMMGFDVMTYSQQVRDLGRHLTTPSTSRQTQRTLEIFPSGSYHSVRSIAEPCHVQDGTPCSEV